jgi:ABC-type Fe3+-hydroxamate transport system substrate-binding protein
VSKPIGQTRIVSLVPSLTQTLYDLNVGPQVVGVTRFCVRPDEARENATVVGGTKDPDVEAVLALTPDLVVADEDENKPEHLAQLADAGVKVHVTRLVRVADAAREVVAIGRILGRGIEAEAWQQRIQERVAEVQGSVALVGRLTAFVPIWRRPWMSMGGATYMSDLLRVCGVDNVLADVAKRYFEVDPVEVRALAPQVVLLPTEPYRFGAKHVSEAADAFAVDARAVAVVDGQALTWFGTHTLRGLDVVAEAVGRLRSRLQNA